MPPSASAIGLILCFSTISFFFALAESALFTLGKWKAKRLIHLNPSRGELILRLLEKPQDLLAVIVLGNTTSNSAIAVVSLLMVFNGNWTLLATFTLVPIWVLTGCEIIPKNLGMRRPDTWSIRIAHPMRIMKTCLLPLARFAGSINAWILSKTIFTSFKPSTPFSDEDYKELVALGEKQGYLVQSEKQMILEIIELDHHTAGDVMKPRSQIACIPDDLELDEMIEQCKEFKYWQLPMFDETPDKIVYVLHTRRLLLDPRHEIEQAIEFPAFVPETMNLLELLKSLQKQQKRLAIVLDEFGGTAGVVTMEDIIEEIVGEIRSEGESPAFQMANISKGKWRVNGLMEIDEFERAHGEFKEELEVLTMGGLMTSEIGIVPEKGQSIEFEGLRMTATSVTNRRIKELTVEEINGN
jgi:CBS domain containing-hemolysin-like protein